MLFLPEFWENIFMENTRMTFVIDAWMMKEIIIKHV